MMTFGTLVAILGVILLVELLVLIVGEGASAVG
jgi:hypothetical protein